MALFGLALILTPSALHAQSSTQIGEIVYDNSDGENTDFFPWSEEYGDELLLKNPPAGQPWILTDFLFEYFGDFTTQGDEKARLRIYQNDGPGKYPSPKSILYDSGVFPIDPGYQTKVLSGLAVTVPNDLTWTIQFSGMRGVKGDQAGLLLRNPPSIGKSFKDFWINGANGWTLSQIEPQNPNLPPDPVTNPDPIENFACRLYAAPVAPPPAQARLKVQRSADSLMIEWTGAGRLQASDSAIGGYSDVAGSSSPHKVKVSEAPRKFWRVVN